MNSMTNKGSVQQPTIQLDTTLTELYQTHCPSLKDKRIAHIFCGTTCAADLSQAFPRNRKYVYQDSAFNDASFSEKSEEDIRRLLASKYLSLVPQRDSFIAGKAPVIFFHSGSTQAEIEHDRRETEKTHAAIHGRQRPEIIQCSGPRDFAEVATAAGIQGFSSKLILDHIAHAHPKSDSEDTIGMLVDADMHWTVNSKEALANSGLPTPASEIVEVQGYCPMASQCCETCSASTSHHVSPNCTGPREEWLRRELDKIVSATERCKLPFVFKNQQSFGGSGTYVVPDEAKRKEVLAEMSDGGIFRRMLSHITSENVHLRPGTVLLTSMVEDVIADIGVTFFVSEAGAAIFLAASEQMIDPATASWIGSKISYTHQNDLRKKFGDITDRIASWLHKQGYMGPAGADILETRAGDFQIVDLNVRTSGSLCLPLMREHFTSRGFMSATSISITIPQSREEFCEKWREEVESGQLCILAWYEDEYAGKSFGDVVVGAEDEERLSEVLERVRRVSEKVTF